MPIARVQLANGKIARISVPDGTTPQQALHYAQDLAAQPSSMDSAAPPSDTGNAVSRFVRGAGRGLSSNLTGLLERFGAVSPQQIDAQRTRDFPLMNTTSGAVGNFVGAAAPWMAASAVAPGSTLLRSALSQGLLGGAQGFTTPTGTNPEDSALMNTLGGAVGGAAMGGLSHVASRFLTPYPNVPKARLDKYAQAQQQGFQPLASQVTGSKALAMLEGIGGKSAERDAANQAALNAQVAHHIGQPGERYITPDVLSNAFEGNANTFNQLAQGTTLDTRRPAFRNAVQKLIDEYNLRTPANQSPELEKHIKDMVTWYNQGTVSGETYAANRSLWSKAARSRTGNDQHFYSQLIKAADAAAPWQTSWDAARQEYMNLLNVAKPGVVDSFGNVQAKPLYTATRKFKGTNPLRDTADAAAAFPPQSGASPTAGAGAAMLKAMTHGAIGTAVGGGIGSYMYGAKDPDEMLKSAAMGGGAALVGPYLIKQLMSNPAMTSYLTKGLIGGADVSGALAPGAQLYARYKANQNSLLSPFAQQP